MARPHTLFIQAQDIPWSTGTHGSGRADVACKTLSIDAAGTDATLILRYPPGWHRTAPEWMDADQEFLVLDGAITINGQRYDRHSYAFLPRGFARETAESAEGAVLFTMVSDRPSIHEGTPPAGIYDERLLIRHIDPLAMEWDPGLVDPQLAKGAAIKPLRTDPDTGAVSFLYCSPPHRVPPGMAKPRWTHPMVEEIYCLAGEYVWGDCGRMGPGGYVWWREGEWHGPAGTDTGYNLFVRTIGAPLVNEFGTEKHPFTWDPPFRPVLPERLETLAKPYKAPPNY